MGKYTRSKERRFEAIHEYVEVRSSGAKDSRPELDTLADDSVSASSSSRNGVGSIAK
jgi:hypothetical protein